MHSRRRFAALQSFSSVPEQHFPKIDVTCYFSTFPPIEGALKRATTAFQLREAVAFWARVWSASLFPVQTESHRRKPCLPSAALQPQPCEVSRPRRHMFGISASIHVEHGRYMLQEPRRAKQTRTHTYQYDSAPDAAPSSTDIFKQTDFQETLKRGKAREKQNSCFRGG